jgi:hypothetical protein
LCKKIAADGVVDGVDVPVHQVSSLQRLVGCNGVDKRALSARWFQYQTVAGQGPAAGVRGLLCQEFHELSG